MAPRRRRSCVLLAGGEDDVGSSCDKRPQLQLLAAVLSRSMQRMTGGRKRSWWNGRRSQAAVKWSSSSSASSAGSDLAVQPSSHIKPSYQPRRLQLEEERNRCEVGRPCQCQRHLWELEGKQPERQAVLGQAADEPLCVSFLMLLGVAAPSSFPTTITIS